MNCQVQTENLKLKDSIIIETGLPVADLVSLAHATCCFYAPPLFAIHSAKETHWY